MSDPPLPPLFPLPKSMREIASLPSDAVHIGGRSFFGSPVYYIPSANCVLKMGDHIKMAEAEAMRIVANHTSVPVPEVYDSYEVGGKGYIYMSKVEGHALDSVWPDLSDYQRMSIVAELRGYIQQWRSIHGNYYGAPFRSPCPDVLFHHISLRDFDTNTYQGPYMEYGPYDTREAYNEGLLEALTNARPQGELQFGEAERFAIAQMSQLRDNTKVFTHGDIHMGNILVNDSGKITGIIDWGDAGYSIKEREYFETKSRALDPQWRKAVDMIFPEEDKTSYEIIKLFDRQLVACSGM